VQLIKAMVWFWGGLYAILPFVLPMGPGVPVSQSKTVSMVSSSPEAHHTVENDWQNWPADDAYAASCVCRPMRIRFAHLSPLGHDRQHILTKTFEAIGEELEAMGLADHQSCRLVRANIRYVTTSRLNRMKDAGKWGKRIKGMKFISGVTDLPEGTQASPIQVYIADDLKPQNLDAELAHELAHLWWFKLAEPGYSKLENAAVLEGHEAFAVRVEKRFREKNALP